MCCVTRWVAFVSVGVHVSQRILLSVLARNSHKGLVHETSHETGTGGEKEGPRKDRRRTHSAEGSSRDQLTEQVSQEMRVGQRGD